MGSVRGWGTIKQRRDGWQVDILVGGHRIRRLYPTYEIAEVKLKELRNARAVGAEPRIDAVGTTYAEAIPEVIAAYQARGVRPRTFETYRYELDRVRADWGRKSIGATRPRDVEAWIGRLRGEGLSSSTIRHLCDRLAAIHDHAERNELVRSACRVGRPRLVSPARKPPSEAELEQLVAAARLDWDRRRLAILLLAADAGLRESEIASLAAGDVELEGGWVTVRSGKGGAQRRLPILTTRLRTAIEGLGPLDGQVFGAAHRGSARRIVAPLWRRVLPGRAVDLHALRHRFTTVALGAPGVPPDQVRQWLGHGDLRTTARYTHERESSVPEALRTALEGEERKAPGGHRSKKGSRGRRA